MFEIIRPNLINPRVLKATVTQFAREDVGLLRDDFAQKDFKISPPFRISTINYASFNVTLIHLMLDHGIFCDIFGSQQLRAKILSNSWQEAKPVQRAMTGSYGRGRTVALFFYVASYVVPQICHDIYTTGVLEVARVGHK